MNSSQDSHEYCTGGFDPDDIVISGMSGRFPECETVGEFKEALYSKKNLIVFSDARYEKGSAGMPYSSCATLKRLDQFDSEFFQCANTLANKLDPSARIHLEVVYEAIADAGYDASDLRGERIGIFNATIADDSNKICCAADDFLNLTSLRSMNPNRASYAMGFTGASVAVDTACSSAQVAFWSAVLAIKSGHVDAAVVSGCQLNLVPYVILAYMGMGIHSMTGNSRPYDSKADGMIKAEAVCAIFLQKASVARRAYATVKATRFYSAGYVPKGIGVPSKSMEMKIMLDALGDAKVHPDEIHFIEGHGTGTPVGDPIEANAMDEVFSTKTRTGPLLLGSVKSNMGHAEASAGLCSTIKALLAFETGMISPNINYEAPNPDSEALLAGRVAIVTEPTPLESDYIPVNSLGFGGTLTETILKKNPRTYDNTKTVSSVIPRIVLFPATTEEAINYVFDYIENNPDLQEEFFALLSKLSFADPFYKRVRGYAVYQKEKPLVTEIKHVAQDKRQVWFIMTGMGCQWPGMGLQLMKIDIFAKSMLKSAEILKEYGIDLFELLRPDKNYFHMDRKITASFVSICSIQIALLDVLKVLDVIPDGIIGHSVGELVAAYADGACSHEQTLTAAYLRGYSVESTNFPECGMAAVGMSWSQAEKMCPKDVYPACDNADDSVTLSGLKEPLAKFIEKLDQDKVFARSVNAHGYGFHCKLIHDAAPMMKTALKKLIPNPKPRSERWISTSYPESQWDSPDCKLCGAEYFCNNLMTRVRFNDAVKRIPSDAVIIEIGPHFLLQSILKRIVGPGASYHGLMKRNGEDNVIFFMESLGKLYNAGVNPKIEQLYPAVQFPVPRGTPIISDLIKWNHSQSYFVPKYSPRSSQFTREFRLDKEDAYLLDHGVDGRTLFPATGYVMLAWEALAARHQKNFIDMPIVIEDFKIERATITKPETPVKFIVNILDCQGHFEIMEGKSLVAFGKICENKKITYLEGPPIHTSDDTCVSGRDIYDELRRFCYEYGPAFQGVVECSQDGNSGLIQWQGRWIPFLDAALRIFGVSADEKGLLIPTGLKYLKIDPNALREYIRTHSSTNKEQSIEICNIPGRFNPNTKLFRSIGIEICDLNWEPIPVRGKDETAILEEYRFIPYVNNYSPTGSSCLQFSQYLNAFNQLAQKLGKSLKKDVKQFQFELNGKNDIRLHEMEASEDGNILKCLKTISNDPESLKNKRKEYLCTYSHTAGKDILNNALVNEDSLKIMLGIILENTYRKLSVVEINRDFPVVLLPATEIMQKYGYLKFKKSILITPKTAVIEQEILSDRGIQQNSDDMIKTLEKEKSQDVAISSFTCGPLNELKNLLHTLTSVIKSNGFILLFFKEKTNRAEEFLSSICGEELQVRSQTELEAVLQAESLLMVSKISDPFGGSLYLLRRPNLEPPQNVLKITDSNYDWVEKLKKEMCEKETGIVWLVSEEGPINGILGMMNCLKQEPGGERIRCIFVSREKQKNNFPPFSFEHPLFRHLILKNLVMNVWKDGTWGSYRHTLIKEPKTPRLVEHSYVNCRKYGDLSSLEWIESRVKYAPPQDMKLVHIYYSALNFKDIMLATGKLAIGTTSHQNLGKSVLGFEFSGREESGKRVCGFAPARTLATSILAEPRFCLDVPQNWTLEQAATVPIVYATCYYALVRKARLEAGESILIHSGSGGIGQAAIAIALSLNCEVFTTVGNDEKRKYIKKKFPSIKDENIGCSRDVSFQSVVLTGTNGSGVDVILNSLADDKFQANFRCIAKNGRIVEIGKYDLSLDRPINTKTFLKDVSFHAVFLDEILESHPKARRAMAEVMDLMREGIRTGVVQPLERTVFGRTAVEDAFRYMTKGVHVGKVLLKIRDEEPEKSAVPKTLALPAIPDTQFYYNKVYIIIGGLGGFGMEVTEWAIERGAKNIILTSRFGARTPYHHYCLKRWKDAGLNVQVSTLNVAKRSDAEKLLQEAMRIGPLGGIFNSAVVLKDAFIEVQTVEDYKEVCAPKADATKYLDELTRKLCPDLDHFVCFSSISCGRGNAGQSNYGYANSVMERICEERKKDGLSGLAIQWGIIGDVGVVHRHMGEDAMIVGVVAQSARSCLQSLDASCQQNWPVVASFVAAEQSKKSTQGNALQQILKILGVKDISQINVTRSLSEIGIDSMVGVEIKQIIELNSDISVTMQEIQEMKLDDIKAIFEKADNEKSNSKAPALIATINLNLPPTMAHKNPVVELNKDGTGEPIFIVHIKDTDVFSFQPLAKALNRTAFALVFTKDLPSTDMESLAKFYLKIIQNITEGPYHLMGVSEGACLAFEMALQSERSPKLKSLSLISGSEHLMNSLTMDIADKTDTDVMAICGFIEQFTSYDISKLKEELEKNLSLDQRIGTVFNYLTNSSSQVVNKNEVSEAVSNYLVKRRILDSYIPSKKLSMDMNLLEDPSQFLANDVSIVKQVLTQLCSGKVIVHRVFSPSLLSTEDGAKRLAETVQSIL